MVPSAGDWQNLLQCTPNVFSATGLADTVTFTRLASGLLQIHAEPPPSQPLTLYLTLWEPDAVLNQLEAAGPQQLEADGRSWQIMLRRSRVWSAFDRYFYHRFGCLQWPGLLPPFFETRKLIELHLHPLTGKWPASVHLNLADLHPCFAGADWQTEVPVPAVHRIESQRLTPKTVTDGYEYAFGRMTAQTLLIVATTRDQRQVFIQPACCSGPTYVSRELLTHYTIYQADPAAEPHAFLSTAETLRNLCLPCPHTDWPNIRQSLGKWPTGSDLEDLLAGLPITREYGLSLVAVEPVTGLDAADKKARMTHPLDNYGWFLQADSRLHRLPAVWAHWPLLWLKLATVKPLPPVFAANVQAYLAAYLQRFFSTGFGLLATPAELDG